MKLVAKCSAFVSLSYQVHVKVYNPIPLSPHRPLVIYRSNVVVLWWFSGACFGVTLCLSILSYFNLGCLVAIFGKRAAHLGDHMCSLYFDYFLFKLLPVLVLREELSSDCSSSWSLHTCISELGICSTNLRPPSYITGL